MNTTEEPDKVTPEEEAEWQRILAGEAPKEPEPEPEPEEPKTVEVALEFNKAGRICNYHLPFRPEELDPEPEESEAIKAREVEPRPLPEVERTYQISYEEFDRFNLICGRKYKLADDKLVYDESLPMAQPDLMEATPLSQPSKGPPSRR